MVRNLTIKTGFTIFELIAVLVIITVLLVGLICSSYGSINRVRFQATVREMNSIAEAAMNYYNASSNDPHLMSWPLSLASLSPVYMPQTVTLSPLGSSYQLSYAHNAVTVSTRVPKGVLIDPTEGTFLNIIHDVHGNFISVTKSIPNDFTGRLSYDLQFVDR